MGDYAVNLSASASDDAQVTSLPPQMVARWAALAAERAALAFLPQQVRSA